MSNMSFLKITTSIFPSLVLGDITPEGYTNNFSYCFEITNLDEYPDYQLFFQIKDPRTENDGAYWLIKPGECIYIQGYRLQAAIVALPKKEVLETDLLTLVLPLPSPLNQYYYNENGDLTFRGMSMENYFFNMLDKIENGVVSDARQVLIKKKLKLEVISQESKSSNLIQPPLHVPIGDSVRTLRDTFEIKKLTSEYLELKQNKQILRPTEELIFLVIPPLIGLILIALALIYTKNVLIKKQNTNINL